MLMENQIEDLHLYLNMICDIINLVFNKMEETFQSNTLDWSSLVIIIIILFLSHYMRSAILCHFSSDLSDIWPVDR